MRVEITKNTATVAMKQFPEKARRRLRIIIQALLRDLVEWSRKTMPSGSYTRTGPRGGMVARPPAVRWTLTKRRGASAGLAGSFSFDMIKGAPAGVAFIRSEPGRKDDPAIYGPALYRRGGESWNPLGKGFRAVARKVRYKLQDALNKAVRE